MPNSITTTINESRVQIIDSSSNATCDYGSMNLTTGTMGSAGAAHGYCEMLGQALDDCLNSESFKLQAGTSPWIRYHRDDEAPTAIIVPTLADRSMTVNMKDPYTNNTMPAKATTFKGEVIQTLPSEDALMFSVQLDRYDSQSDGTVTELTLQQEIMSIGEQIDNALTVQLLEALEKGDKAAQYMAVKDQSVDAGASHSVRLEAIEDCFDQAMVDARHLGATPEDFIVGLSGQAFRDAARAARRAGHSDVSRYFGTEVFQYNATDAAEASIIVAPRRHVALSFRERADGLVFDCKVTRRPELQGSSLEITAVVDMLISGQTKAQTADGTDVDVTIPLVQKYKLVTP